MGAGSIVGSKVGDASTLKPDHKNKLSFDVETFISGNETRLFYGETEDLRIELKKVASDVGMKGGRFVFENGDSVGRSEMSDRDIDILDLREGEEGSVALKTAYAEINFLRAREGGELRNRENLIGYEIGLFAMSLLYLPGLRDQPQRSYPQTAQRPPYAGPFPPYTASVLARWQENKETDKLTALFGAVKRLGLTLKKSR